jgi:hypothetical protein
VVEAELLEVGLKPPNAANGLTVDPFWRREWKTVSKSNTLLKGLWKEIHRNHVKDWCWSTWPHKNWPNSIYILGLGLDWYGQMRSKVDQVQILHNFSYMHVSVVKLSLYSQVQWTKCIHSNWCKKNVTTIPFNFKTIFLDTRYSGLNPLSFWSTHILQWSYKMLPSILHGVEILPLEKRVKLF